jgi:hypothetical protein
MTASISWKYHAMHRPSDGKWCVFVRHNDTPEWFRLIGEFANQKRAVAYADIENDCAEDCDADNYGDIEHAGPKVLPGGPVSQITPQNFLARTPAPRLPSPAEKARVGAHLIDTAASETKERGVCEVVLPAGSLLAKTLLPSQGAPKPSRSLPESVHSDRATQLLKAVQDHLDEEDTFPSHTQMAARSGISAGSLATYLTQLEDRGDIAKNAQGCRYLKSRPDRPALPKYGAQAAAVASAAKNSPASALVSATKTIQARKQPSLSIRQEIDATVDAGAFNHQMQRRCQGCNTLFKTDSIKQYLCDGCDSSAARLV